MVIILAAPDSVSAPSGFSFGGLVNKINLRLNEVSLMTLITSRGLHALPARVLEVGPLLTVQCLCVQVSNISVEWLYGD